MKKDRLVPILILVGMVAAVLLSIWWIKWIVGSDMPLWLKVVLVR